ncbi:apolipoprotein M isoform X2 [Bufo gargarizans]|uniref:apolipoprotein M isoform X2 n=1 Tax=Bufo gargarizans TaxID=30331 RepID=UPI001CF54E4D|nr:apolipoprotein M isoform X2 [Bufo gargarizans]
MIVSAWRGFLYFYGLVFDSLSGCDTSDQLSASHINRTEYLGSWYFLAAAAEPGTRALDIFRVMDNGRFMVQESTDVEKLEFRASIRVRDEPKDGSCVPRTWIYLLTENSTELRTEGHPDRLTELFSCHCPDCVILKETDETTSRLLLYSRSPRLDEDCMDKFKHKSTCEGYKDVLQLPQTLEQCPLEK